MRARAGRGASSWLDRGRPDDTRQGRAPSCPASHGPRLDHPAAAGTSRFRAARRERRGFVGGKSRGVRTETAPRTANSAQCSCTRSQASAAYLSSPRRACCTAEGITGSGTPRRWPTLWCGSTWGSAGPAAGLLMLSHQPLERAYVLLRHLAPFPSARFLSDHSQVGLVLALYSFRLTI